MRTACRFLLRGGLLVVLGVSAGAARGAVRQFRVLFGTSETAARAWDGSVSVEGGQLAGLASWRFQKPDALEGATAWTCRTRWRTARKVARWEPSINSVRPGYLQRPGVFVAVDGNAETIVNVETKHGAFSFRPAGFHLGAKKLYLEGRVQVEEVPAQTQLSDNATFDDYPAIATGPDGAVWTAWVSYGRDSDQVLARAHRGDAWGEVEVVSERPGDHYRVDLAFDGQGRLWAVWSEQREGNWDLYARVRGGAGWSEVRRVTTAPGPDMHHRLASRGGRVYLTWQRFGAQGRSDIHLAASQGDGFGAPVRVSPSPANDWEPTVAVAPDRTVWVAWDSYARENYDVFIRAYRQEGGRLTATSDVLEVAASPLFESHPSIDVDAAGRVWVAYDEGGIQWGKDTGYRIKRSGSGLYMERFVRVVCMTPQGRRVPAEAIESEFPYEVRRFNDYPQLQVDAEGRVWVFFRHRTLRLWSGYGNAAHRALWQIYGTYYTGDRWSEPVSFPSSAGRSDMRTRTAIGADGRLWAVWPDDARVPNGYLPERVNVHAAKLPKPKQPAATPKLQQAAAGPSFENVVHPNEAADVALLRRHRAKVGGKTYRIVRGDFHRHTDISHDGTKDGSLLDAYRYAIDAAAHDFLGVTDHDYGANDYDWWRTQKTVDLFLVPNAFVPMYAYERSLSYPNGHRNVVHAVRGVRALPRTEGTKKNTGPLLYPHLRATGGIAMSHTSATGMGTDWRDNDPELEPVVEIFQGDRNSYEHAGAPLAPTAEQTELHKGGYRPKGFVWEAWAKGYKLGVQASSDHVSTHCSYCCIYVSDFTRAGILDGLKRRHCYGATDNILMDVRLITRDGEHLMGDLVRTAERPRFRIHIDGTARLEQVDVIKNNTYVFQHKPEGDAVTLEYRDAAPSPGESYYYVRVQQTDGHVAWSSPIWISRP